MKENSIPVQRIVPNRRLVLNERFFGTAIFFHNVINFSTFQPFHSPSVTQSSGCARVHKVMNVGRRPCQPFHRECFYVTGTPTYSLVFDQQRESY